MSLTFALMIKFWNEKDCYFTIIVAAYLFPGRSHLVSASFQITRTHVTLFISFNNLFYDFELFFFCCPFVVFL